MFDLPDETTAATTVADPQEQQLVEYEQKAAAIVLVDDASESVAMFIIAKLREYETGQDKERRAITDPLNKQIEDISRPYNERKAKAKLEREKLTQRLGDYRTQKEQQRQEQQRLANLEAEQDRLKKLAEADKARHEAEQRREAGDELGAAKLEGKAQRAELIAVSAAPEIVPQQPKTTTLFDGSKLTVREDRDWVFANGLAKEEDYYRNDPRLKDLPDEFFKLDRAAISARVRASRGSQPDSIPGIKIVPKTTTVHRRGGM
jgi:hypothetical protein